MKKIILALVILLPAINNFAQSDTTRKPEPDTIVAGKFVIIKKNNNNDSNDSSDKSKHSWSVNIPTNEHRYHSVISTNWFILDLGFANYNDKTNYTGANTTDYLQSNGGAAFTKEDFKLKTIKSSNVNIWLFMQKLNVTKHVLNLKYGLGLEMYNLRYENNISYHSNPAYIFRDSLSFSKDKLYLGYATVPFMLNINTTPHHHHGLSLSAGVSAGYLIANHNKEVSDERGKQKIRGDFDLEKWRLAYIAELGLGPVHLYGSYKINNLYEQSLKQYPYAVGVRFSNW